MDPYSSKWREALIKIDSTISDVVCNLETVAIKIALVVNSENKLVGTISDGDVRRGLLKGLGLNSPIESIVHKNALIVPPKMPKEIVKKLMLANKIFQIPIVDEFQKVIGLYLWDEIVTEPIRPNLMIIMAGGKGQRLLPYTENCPKPMISVSGKPILEHIIERAKLEGFSHFVIAIHHLGKVIEDYFGDGKQLEVKIEYLREEYPLGTAGALNLLNSFPELPFVVTNGDVITDVRYGELLDFHSQHNAIATMAVRIYEWQNPFGVVKLKGLEIEGFEEKPITKSHINTGVYVLSPNVLNELSDKEPCDMPILFERLRAKEKRVIAYPVYESWLDVGRPTDLEKANIFLKKGA